MVFSPQVYSLSCTHCISKKTNFTATQMKNKHIILDERLSCSEKKDVLIDIWADISDCAHNLNMVPAKNITGRVLCFAVAIHFFLTLNGKNPVSHVE